MNNYNIKSGSNNSEINFRNSLFSQFKCSPIPDNELLSNLGLYINRQSLSRILFMHELYQKIINIHGVIMEFGVRWGQNLALFESFRGIYEPYNYNRKIIGFDTFSGFQNVSKKDGNNKNGNYSVSKNYKTYLENILNYHEKESPLNHKKKFELIKGDASITIKKYLKNNLETIIAFAYFDFDIYKPTKICLKNIIKRMPKGSIIVFDELNCSKFPGETKAFLEIFNINKYKLNRSPLNPLISYIVIGE